MPALAFGSFFDGTPTRQERACLASFVRAGHRIRLYTYAPVDLPPGVEARDAAEIIPQAELYRDATGGRHDGTVSQFTNHFRYAMIARTGLVWVDTDVICLKRDWPQTDWLLALQDGCLVNGAILGAPRDHPFLARAREAMERLRGLSIWGIGGPHLLTALVGEYRLWGRLLPTDMLYPLHFAHAAELLRPLQPGERLQIPAGALCIHLWNEVLRLHGYDRAAGPPQGSALAALLDAAEGVGVESTAGRHGPEASQICSPSGRDPDAAPPTA